MQRKLQRPEGEAKFSSVPNLTVDEPPQEERATVATSVFERNSPEGDKEAEAAERDHLSQEPSDALANEYQRLLDEYKAICAENGQMEEELLRIEA